ncbi:DUF397 domain-containing protein [Kitasatospora kifunensis]|uniref:DUF397 domain-containing protein n=1 Tax=Kitasatospora kifunensis TaxID=58351 RepID=A0A7W7QY21_KITKI|nr:DUF397 domain-containing protein [Kitasatospora kifunensis]MBB4921892.1 hypothetical protein [Kitasatospora kifunensis]
MNSLPKASPRTTIDRPKTFARRGNTSDHPAATTKHSLELCGWYFSAGATLVAVRDSKRPEQIPLVYTRDEIKAMILGAKASAFNHLV